MFHFNGLVPARISPNEFIVGSGHLASASVVAPVPLPTCRASIGARECTARDLKPPRPLTSDQVPAGLAIWPGVDCQVRKDELQ